jgi:hypothetical protein
MNKINITRHIDIQNQHWEALKIMNLFNKTNKLSTTFKWHKIISK